MTRNFQGISPAEATDILHEFVGRAAERPMPRSVIELETILHPKVAPALVSLVINGDGGRFKHTITEDTLTLPNGNRRIEGTVHKDRSSLEPSFVHLFGFGLRGGIYKRDQTLVLGASGSIGPSEVATDLRGMYMPYQADLQQNPTELTDLPGEVSFPDSVLDLGTEVPVVSGQASQELTGFLRVAASLTREFIESQPF